MSEHDWIVYDEHHRACRRCGTRLFMRRRGGALYHDENWTLIDHNGVVSVPLLSSGGNKWGICRPPPSPPIVDTLIIEYTGDPDVHPGCERFMHRVAGWERGTVLTGSEIVSLETIKPACSWPCQWWELGPARDWQGWTWCGECFPGMGRPRAYVFAQPAKQLPKRPPPRLRLRTPPALAEAVREIKKIQTQRKP